MYNKHWCGGGGVQAKIRWLYKANMELNFTSYFQYKPFRMTQIKRHNSAYDEIICKLLLVLLISL